MLPIWYFGKRNRLGHLWREQLSRCDLVLIGGGQLLMDNDLSFPLKVAELVRIARDLDKHVAFYACGVGREWSWLGSRLFEGALLNPSVSWVSVRDHGSRDLVCSISQCRMRIQHYGRSSGVCG